MEDGMTDKTPAKTGEVLVGVAVQRSLEYFMRGCAAVLQTIATDAEALAEDGYSLADFAVLLRGGEIE